MQKRKKVQWAWFLYTGCYFEYAQENKKYSNMQHTIPLAEFYQTTEWDSETVYFSYLVALNIGNFMTVPTCHLFLFLVKILVSADKFFYQ